MKSTPADAEQGTAAAACWRRPRRRASLRAAQSAAPREKTRRHAGEGRGTAPWPNSRSGAAADVGVASDASLGADAQFGADAGRCIEAALRADGIAIQDQFLAPPQIHALAQCAHLRRARGDFSAARVGGGQALQRREEIRGDSTCWIAEPLLSAEAALLAQFERLRLELNRTAHLGLFELELHYAWYAPGAGYARHVDQPHGRAQRQVSLVLYLNDGWTPAAGGELRIFDTADRHRDIAPIAGRLVCFLTLGRAHAVLPTQRDRLSVTGWFRARE
jgi:SM-20-related protein